jgi:hypothetical protein
MSLSIRRGHGYWDITCYPYGGDFKRAPKDKDLLCEIINLSAGKYPLRECEVRLADGRKAIVERAYLEESGG